MGTGPPGRFAAAAPGWTGSWAFPLDYADAAELPDWAYEPFC